MKTRQMEPKSHVHDISNEMENDESATEKITKTNPNMLTTSVQFFKYRLKRDSPSTNSTFYSKITSFVKENMKCNTMIGRICPGSHIGCAICRYYTKASCSGVCTAQDIICNAALISCLSEKS
jgi:hypothetical protein